MTDFESFGWYVFIAVVLMWVVALFVRNRNEKIYREELKLRYRQYFAEHTEVLVQKYHGCCRTDEYGEEHFDAEKWLQVIDYFHSNVLKESKSLDYCDRVPLEWVAKWSIYWDEANKIEKLCKQ